ncbi:hypothetical protein AB9M62_09415 [Bacillales bacterium AN1005]
MSHQLVIQLPSIPAKRNRCESIQRTLSQYITYGDRQQSFAPTGFTDIIRVKIMQLFMPILSNCSGR